MEKEVTAALIIFAGVALGHAKDVWVRQRTELSETVKRADEMSEKLRLEHEKADKERELEEERAHLQAIREGVQTAGAEIDQLTAWLMKQIEQLQSEVDTLRAKLDDCTERHKRARKPGADDKTNKANFP